jgi:hypothetical protein
MTSVRSRPRFKKTIGLSLEDLKQKMTTKLIQKPPYVKGQVFSEHFHLEITQTEQHFWSPHLNVTLEESNDGTIMRGTYGPKPTIWTVFFFGYSSLGLTFFFTAMVGLVKLSLHQDGIILWALPFLLFMIMGLYFASQTGQKLGSEQTFRIHHFLEETLDERIEID